MPLILHPYDPDAEIKERARAAINHLRVVGLSDHAVPQMPPENEPIRAVFRKDYLNRRTP